MYFVKYGKEYLHDPRIDGRMLLDLSLDCEENSCGFCDFTIYPDHPLYDKLKERDADNPIEVYDDGILLFAGFIYELGKEFYLDGHVRCKGELDYLNETIIRPYSTIVKGYGVEAPDTVNGLFDWYIDQHNAQADANKEFVHGINQGGALIISNLIYEESIDYPRTIEEITNKILNKYGGYLNIRHEDGKRYIDYLKEWTDTNTQILDFGVNLTDYTQTDDSADVSTFIVPLGAKMSETDYPYDDGYHVTEDTVVYASKEYYTESGEGYTRCEDLASFAAGVIYYESNDNGYFVTSDTTVNSEKQYYLKNEVIDGYSQCNDLTAFKTNVTYYEYFEDEDESDLSLTIEGLPAGGCSEPNYTTNGDLIYSKDAVDKYGWIGCTYKNPDIVDKDMLRDAGVIALKALVSPKRTIEIKAVDMHLVNPSIKPIRIGEYVRVRSKPHNLDSYFLCAKIDLDLNNPGNSLYTLGTTFDTLTGQQNKKINELNATIHKQYERVEESLVNQAFEQAENAARLAGNAYTQAVDATAAANAVSNRVDDVDEQITTIETAATETQADVEALSTLVTSGFSEVDQTTDGLTTRVQSAETNITDLSANVVTKFLEVDETADGITARVGTVETNLDNLVVGGRNLYFGTRNFDGDKWNSLNNWELQEQTTWPYKEYKRTGAWQGIYQNVSVVEGEEYVFSFYAKGDANAIMHVYTDWNSTTTTPTYINLGAPSTSTYTRYAFTFTIAATGSICPRVENATDGSWLQVCALKLERGNRETDWTPAPEDAENGIVDAKKQASDYLRFATDGLTVGDMLADVLGKNVNLSGEGVKIRDGETVLAKFSETAIEFDEPIVFTADGILINNGDAYSYFGRNNILYSSTGMVVNADQQVTFSTPMSRQLSGVVFCWCGFQNGAATNANWKYFFVPKSHVINHGGCGIAMGDPYLGMMKYLYVSNGGVTGVAANALSGTANGIAYDNTKFVLRYVIGV